MFLRLPSSCLQGGWAAAGMCEKRRDDEEDSRRGRMVVSEEG